MIIVSIIFFSTVPPSTVSNGDVVTTLAFSNLPTDNVTVNISIVSE